jgi:heme exporter protein A
MSDVAAVEATALGRRYGRRWALVDVSLRVPAGSALLVAGRNGAGKSTLLKVLATALKPDRGRAAVCGHDLVDARADVRRAVALLGHSAYTYMELSAYQNLAVMSRLMARPARRDALLALLSTVGLADRADDPVNTYSAGMRKRLALARVLLQEPRVALLDEPYSQLDPDGTRLFDTLMGHLRARGVTLIIASHQLDRAAALCDDGIVLEGGWVVWSGPAPRLATDGMSRCTTS